jgi:hypothetical protein
MQNATKAMIDSFGPQLLAHSCVVFSRADGRISLAEARARTDEISSLIASRAGIATMPHVPCFQAEMHPENLAHIGVPVERINALRDKVADTLRGDLMRWVRTLSPALSTSTAVAAMYDDRRARLEAEQRENEERRRREYESSIIETSEERRDNFEYKPATYVHHGAQGHNVRRIFGSEYKETQSAYVQTTRYFRSETRTITVYGSNVRTLGDWVAVPGTETTVTTRS